MLHYLKADKMEAMVLNIINADNAVILINGTIKSP